MQNQAISSLLKPEYVINLHVHQREVLQVFVFVLFFHNNTCKSLVTTLNTWIQPPPSLPHPLIPSLTPPSLTHSLTHPLSHSTTHSLTHSISRCSSRSLMHNKKHRSLSQWRHMLLTPPVRSCVAFVNVQVVVLYIYSWIWRLIGYCIYVYFTVCSCQHMKGKIQPIGGFVHRF